MSGRTIELTRKDELIINLVRAEYLLSNLKTNVRNLHKNPEGEYRHTELLMRPSDAWCRKIALLAYGECDDMSQFTHYDLEDYGVENTVADCIWDEIIRDGTVKQPKHEYDSDETSTIDDIEFCYDGVTSGDRWSALENLDCSTLANMLSDTIARYREITEALGKIAAM